MIYIAFVTKGLEEISKEELLAIEGVKIISVDQKVIRFSYEGDITIFNNLITVDDIGIYIADTNIRYLSNLTLENETEKIKSLIPFISKFRNVDKTFSITLSKYKNSEIKEEEIKNNLSKYFTNVLGFDYQPLNHTNLDIRINVNQENCVISLKLFPESLYSRPYGHESKLGAIKSTIAGCIIYKLAQGKDHPKVIDTFCGSGTILCEALTRGMQVYGSDIDPEAIDITKRNLKMISNNTHELKVENASRTSWKNSFFDIAISNFPWNKQIKVNQMYKLIDSAIKEYARVLKPSASIGIISTKPQIVIKRLKKSFNVVHLDEYKIGYLGQTPTIILADVKKI